MTTKSRARRNSPHLLGTFHLMAVACIPKESQTSCKEHIPSQNFRRCCPDVDVTVPVMACSAATPPHHLTKKNLRQHHLKSPRQGKGKIMRTETFDSPFHSLQQIDLHCHAQSDLVLHRFLCDDLGHSALLLNFWRLELSHSALFFKVSRGFLPFTSWCMSSQ